MRKIIRFDALPMNSQVVLVIVSLLAVAWLQMPRLLDEFRVDEDFRYYYWMYKFQDSTLFPNDPSEYYVSIHLPGADVPVTFYGLGFSGLFYLANFFVPPIAFSKLLPFILMPITVLHCFYFGQSVRNRTTGIVLALGFLFLNLASSSSISVANGVQRSFATTFIIALIYYLHRQKYLWAGVVIVVSTLIYAPAQALNLGIWGMYWLVTVWRSRPQLNVIQGGFVYLVTAFCLSVLLLLPVFIPELFAAEESIQTEDQPQSSVEQDAPIDTPPQYTYWWENPSFQRDGHFPVFIVFPLVGRGGLVDLGEDLINLFILLIIAALIYFVRGRKAFHLPVVLWCMLWASLVMFIIAWLVFLTTGDFLFHLPSRYTRSGLYLFLFFFVGLNLVDFIKEAPVLIREHPKRLVGLVVGIEAVIIGLIVWYPVHRATINGLNMKWLLALAGLVFGVLGVMLVKRPTPPPSRSIQITKTLPGKLLIGSAIVLGLGGWALYTPLFTEVSYLNPPPAEREMLEFIRTLPKDALIAGSPCALDSVELFSRRRVLFSCEQLRGEVVQALRAYYAEDWFTVVAFCRENDIDYLVVEPNTYNDEFLAQKKLFFEPFNQTLLADIAGQNKFALAHIPDEVKLFKNERYFVVACSEGVNP